MANRLRLPVSDSESDSENDEVEMEDEEDQESDQSDSEDEEKDKSATENSDSDGDGDVTTRFPFWRLPVLVRSLVTRFMRFGDVIHLSMHSRHFKRLLMAYKIPFLNLTFKFYYTASSPRSFKGPFNGKSIRIDLFFTSEAYSISFACPFKKDKKQEGYMQVHGERMLISRQSAPNRNEFLYGSYGSYAEKMRATEQLTLHFLEICNVQEFKLINDHTPKHHIFDCFVWNLGKKFSGVNISKPMYIEDEDTDEEDEESDEDEDSEDSEESEKEDKEIENTEESDQTVETNNDEEFDEENSEETYQEKKLIKKAGLTHEQLHFLLNTVDTDDLSVSSPVANPFNVTGIQLKRHKNMWLYNCKWLNIDHIIEAECEELYATGMQELQPGKVVELLQKWRSGEKLGKIKGLTCNSLSSLEEVEKVLDNTDGIQILSKREREHINENVSVLFYEKGWKIQRATDRKIAIVGMLGTTFDLNVLENNSVLQ